jgi:Mg2+/Co2+ transporter CorC
MIGSTSTVVSRNGHGGIIKSKGGSIAEQLLALQALSEQIISHLPENTEQEIKCLRDSFFTGLSLVNNSVTLLHKEVETLDQSVDSVVVVLSQILQFLKDSKIILPCVNEDKVAD